MSIVLLPPAARLLAAILLAVSRTTLVLLAVYHVPLLVPDLYNALDYEPLTTLQLERLMAVFFLLPEVGARLVLRHFAGAGPPALLPILTGAGASEAARGPLSQRAIRTVEAREQVRSRLDHPLVKFVIFSLVPALPLFRLRQWLTYGGTFGEYHQFGLKAYLLGFGLFWALSAIYLLLFAAALRTLGEAIAIGGLWALPGRELGVRRVVEALVRAAYYLAPPAALIVRLVLQ